MIWSITVGMVCLNEIRLYAPENVLGIVLAASTSMTGIYFLLQKTKERKEKEL